MFAVKNEMICLVFRSFWSTSSSESFSHGFLGNLEPCSPLNKRFCVKGWPCFSTKPSSFPGMFAGTGSYKTHWGCHKDTFPQILVQLLFLPEATVDIPPNLSLIKAYLQDLELLLDSSGVNGEPRRGVASSHVY